MPEISAIERLDQLDAIEAIGRQRRQRRRWAIVAAREHRDARRGRVGPGLTLGEVSDAACDALGAVNQPDVRTNLGLQFFGEQREMGTCEHDDVEPVAARLVA